MCYSRIMHLSFVEEELETLYVEGKSNYDLSDSVTKAFFSITWRL